VRIAGRRPDLSAKDVPLKSQTTFGKWQNIDLRVARVISANPAEGTRNPCRIIRLDLGPLGERESVGQYALIDESDLVGRNVVACVNLSVREMGPYKSEALVLGAPHPDSPEDQDQATPLYVSDVARPGDCIF
jgi:tRNA-binding protein